MCLSGWAYLVFIALIVGGVAWGIHANIREHGAGGVTGLGTETPCPRCRHLNPTHARYCAHCDRELG